MKKIEAYRSFLFFFSCFLFLIFLFACKHGESLGMNKKDIILPGEIKTWKLEESPKHINSENIFKYMNGSGELYLSYHFDHLKVYEYKNKNQNDILVELYYMKDSDDAFGLLSLDWGGEEVSLNLSPSNSQKTKGVFSTALYGKGLLRIWSGDLYVRIMSVRETPEVRDVIMNLGKIITSGRKETAPPQMVSMIQQSIGDEWVLKKGTISYFYTHLVLNSLYYISHDNILDLNLSTEAVFAVYEKTQEGKTQRRISFLKIKYPVENASEIALDHFLKAYLPDRVKKETSDKKSKSKNFFKIEDGWMGYSLNNEFLSLVFECPDLESAQLALNRE